MLKTGDRMPDFEVCDQAGNTVTQKDFEGKKIVLYFYPKDSTPGCTAEACNLQKDVRQSHDRHHPQDFHHRRRHHHPHHRQGRHEKPHCTDSWLTAINGKRMPAAIRRALLSPDCRHSVR